MTPRQAQHWTRRALARLRRAYAEAVRVSRVRHHVHAFGYAIPIRDRRGKIVEVVYLNTYGSPYATTNPEIADASP